MPLLFKTFKKLLRPFPVGFLYIVFLIVLSWRLGTPTPAHSQAVPDAKVNPPLGEGATAAGIPPDLSKKNVLLLHAYTYETASSMVMDPIFVKGFKEAGLATFNLHFEFMDLAKHPEPAHRRKFVQYLGRKFEKQPIDLIIALHSPALNFLVEEGRNLFPGVPVINVIAGTEFLRNEKLGNAYESRLRPLKRPFVILASSMDVESTVKSIVSLRPDTQTLVVISGSSVLDRMMEEAARRGLQAWQGRLQIEYFSARPLEQVLKQVATLSPKTVILFSNFSADPDGSVYSPPEVVRRINRAANAPVFGLYDTLLGNGGIVGGVMLITFRGEAIRTVQLALEMLRGRLPTEPVTISRTPLIPMFDWEQLKRWALNENRLPPGSIVLNRPGTIWTEYKGFVIGSMAVFLAQALLVIGLLVQRDLKRKAESYLRQKTEELDQFFEVSLDLLGIANTDGNFLRLNPAWERILGHSREELMAKRFLEFVHPDDLDRTREAISALRSQQKVLSFENRYRCKDGTYRWLQWSSAPAGKLIYAAARDVTENKQSEEALRKAEEKYRSIFEGALEGIYETSPEGQYLTANPALAKMLGVGSPDEVTSLTKDSALQVWVDPNLREEYARLIEAKGVVLGFEVQFWCKDRTKIWVSISGRRVCGPNGQTLLHSGFIEDITERKGVEEALQEIELKYRRLYESMREAFVKVDMGGRIQEFNSAYQTMLGYSAGELRKKTYQDLIPENWHDKERKIIAEQVLPRGYSEVYEKEYRRKDGTVFPVELRTFLLKDAAGGHSGMWAIVRDITERKRTEEALKQSEERFRQVAENVGDFIWETDANGLYRYTSPSVERILGYRPDELEGKKHFYDLFSPEVRGELKAAALAVFAAKQPLRVFLNKNLSKEGKVVYLETSGAPVLDAAGYLVGYRGADTNVTERRRAEEELSQYREHLEDLVRGRTAELIAARERAEAANQAKSVFLANMSHELRSPLNSILGIAQLMDRDHELSPKHRELLGILGRSGQQLFDLIDDVLEMSRIEAGQTTAVIKTFDLHRFLDDLEEMMAPRAEKKGLGLTFERDSSLPQYIQTDGRKLRQILINLLGNAIKFTEKGSVTLRTGIQQNMDNAPEKKPAYPVRLEFEVKDTGIGIPEEDRERIFEPFVQLNPVQKPSGGIGLGLAISRKFAGLLGGEITVRSEFGRGATFKLNIAVQPAEENDIPVQPSALQVMGLAPDHPRYRLLIVDDHWESRLLLRQLLEPAGFSILEAASGREAVQLHERHQPHLVWMDIRMPEMNGYEAAWKIREAERARRNEEGREIHTPIIALTAGVMENTGSSSRSSVFDDWVYKPFRETEIFDKIQKHLGVQFVYRPSASSMLKPEEAPDKAALTPADLSLLPADWLQEFFQTMKKGRSRQLLNLIDQVRPQHSDLARDLAKSVRIHRFDKLIPLFQGALKEKGNG